MRYVLFVLIAVLVFVFFVLATVGSPLGTNPTGFEPDYKKLFILSVGLFLGCIVSKFYERFSKDEPLSPTVRHQGFWERLLPVTGKRRSRARAGPSWKPMRRWTISRGAIWPMTMA